MKHSVRQQIAMDFQCIPEVVIGAGLILRAALLFGVLMVASWLWMGR